MGFGGKPSSQLPGLSKTLRNPIDLPGVNVEKSIVPTPLKHPC